MVPYRESWAAIIGIDEYVHWPKLRYAVNDAKAIQELLVRKFGFRPDHVFTLLNREATRQNILSLMGDRLANPELVKRDDRVFVFFAGHGATRKLPSGRDLGYIVPVEADANSFHGQSISMTSFQDIAEAIPAKHIFFVMDSCFSGLAITRGGAGNSYPKEMARRVAREVFTAGGADQEVADGGPNGHSIFTWTLLQSLEGKGDLNGDGIITAPELAAYVSPVVSSLSRQTPAFGNLPGSEGGTFFFELRNESEYLSDDTKTLSDEGIRLNAEIEKLRAELSEKGRLNEQLRKELAAVQSTPQTRDDGKDRNDRGMALFKEKRYREALDEFLAAVKIDPGKALFANNAGFACYKLGDYPEAVKWFEKTVKLAPRRAVAWVNLGDAYAMQGRKSEARKAYENYLRLAPNAAEAPQIREKLTALKE
jgi:TolA-binding protein